MKNLQEKLNRALVKSGLSKAEVADRAEIGVPYLRLILAGKRLPRSPILLAGLARALKIPESVLRTALLEDVRDAADLKLARGRSEKASERERDTEAAAELEAAPISVIRAERPRRRKV